MEIFNLGKQPEYIEKNHQLYNIEKIINEYDFLSDTEKITLIKCILKGSLKEV